MPRWVFTGFAVIASLGCGAGPFSGSRTDAGADGLAAGDSTEVADTGTFWSSLSLRARPAPKLDLLFVIDSAPSMAAKQSKLAAQLAKLVPDLKNGCNGDKLDLRLAVITSDMGSDGWSPSGSCGPKANGPLKGDQGSFRFANAAACGVTDTTEPWLFEDRNVSPIRKNFTGDIGAVFACLVSQIGASGCDFSQPLQALEAAFYDPSNVPVQRERFLRPEAQLGIVIVSDQDDCSVGSNSRMFASSTLGESRRLRCTTRGLACAGQNLSISGPGYPSTSGFATALADCAPRTDVCSPDVDTSQPTDCTPLVSYRVIADEIKLLKHDGEYEISVAGIFGWPIDEAQLANARLVIGRTPNPDPADDAHPELLDIWPVCYDPSHPPQDPAGSLDGAAAAAGAVAGVRLAAFVDEFGWGGSKRSICQSDFSSALENLVSICIDGMQPCIEDKLVDGDPAQPGVQPNCRVWDSVPAPGRPEGPYADSPPFPRCDDSNAELPCWELVKDRLRCWDRDQLIRVRRSPDTTFNLGTSLNIQCLVCAEGFYDTTPGCDYDSD